MPKSKITDEQRIDWLESSDGPMWKSSQTGQWGWGYREDYQFFDSVGRTFRQAIDDKIREQRREKRRDAKKS